MSLESCEFEKSLYLHISTFWWRFETFSCSPCSPLFTHEPSKDSFAFPGSGTIWCKAKEGALPCCSFFQPPVFIQGPLQILDILTIFLKGCLLVHLSLPPVPPCQFPSQNVTNTTQTCLRVGFQHRENLLLLLSLPPFCFSRVYMIQASLLSQLAWTNTGRTCSSYCLFSPPLVLELGLQSNPLDLLGPPLPSAKILLETCFFSNHDLTALTHGEVLSRLAGKLPKRVELVAKEAQYIGGKWLFVGKIEKCDGASPLQD